MAITKSSLDDQNPWFRVDLEDLYLVQTVKVIRRLDCCFGNMETVEVRVGESESTTDSLFEIVVTGRAHTVAELRISGKWSAKTAKLCSTNRNKSDFH